MPTSSEPEQPISNDPADHAGKVVRGPHTAAP